MSTDKVYRGYTGEVFFGEGSSNNLCKVRGWSYKIYLDGQCVGAAGGFANREEARVAGKEAIRWDIGQKGRSALGDKL